MKTVLAIWMTVLPMYHFDQTDPRDIPQEAKKALEKYKAATESAKKAYDAAIAKAREQVAKDLKAVIQNETTKGNVDVASSVKAKLDDLQDEKTTNPPSQPADPIPSVNLALNKTVLASNSDNGDGVRPPSSPDFAVDGNNNTRWSSTQKDREWLAVDLGSAETISRVEIAWEAAYAVEYAIEVSSNGKSWIEVARKKDGQGGLDVVKFPPTKARWVRWSGIRRCKPGWPYSFWEFRIFSN